MNVKQFAAFFVQAYTKLKRRSKRPRHRTGCCGLFGSKVDSLAYHMQRVSVCLCMCMCACLYLYVCACLCACVYVHVLVCIVLFYIYVQKRNYQGSGVCSNLEG